MTPHHILSSYFLLLLLFVSSTFASAVMKAVTKCTNEWMGSVSFTCGAGTMLHVEDAVHYSNDNPAKTWKAAGVKAACGRSPSCLIFFSIFWSGEQSKWIRCYKITYRCETVTCSKPEAPAFGSAKFSSIGLNSVVSYSCQEGYRLRGTPVSRCMHKGKYFDWSTPAPICEIAYDKCPSKSNSRHPMGSYGSVCYEFVLEEKTWGEADNNCRKRNGTLVSIASKDFLKTALLTTPALNMRSMWGYFWTAKNGNSECKLLVVNVEDAINHHYDTAEECQEKNNYICQYEPNLPKKCPLLETPPHGILDTHNDTIGTIVTHSCLAGYKLNGTSTRKCLPSGMWSKEKPHCVVHDCGPLVVADESGITSVSYNSTTYLSTAKYSCKSGYRILGIATRRCNGFGQWAGTQPKKKKVPTATLR